MPQKRETVPINSQVINSIIGSKGYKKEWIAATLKVSRITVSRWVNGHVKRINRENLAALANCLECSPQELTESHSVDSSLQSLEQKNFSKMKSILAIHCKHSKIANKLNLIIKESDSPTLVLDWSIALAKEFYQSNDLQSAKEVVEFASFQARRVGESEIIVQLEYLSLAIARDVMPIDKAIDLFSVNLATNDSNRIRLYCQVSLFLLYHRYGDFYLAKYELIRSLAVADFDSCQDVIVELFFNSLLLSVELGDVGRIEELVAEPVFSQLPEYTHKVAELSIKFLNFNQGTDSLIQVMNSQVLPVDGIRYLAYCFWTKKDSDLLALVLEKYPLKKRGLYFQLEYDFYKYFQEYWQLGYCNSQLSIGCLDMLNQVGSLKRIPLTKEKFFLQPISSSPRQVSSIVLPD